MQVVKLKSDYTGIIVVRQLIDHHLQFEMVPRTAAAAVIYSLLIEQQKRFNSINKTMTDRNILNLKMHDALCLQLVLRDARARLSTNDSQPLMFSYTVNLEEQISRQLA